MMKDIRSFYLKSRTVNGRNCGKNKFKYYTILFYGIMTEKLIVTTHVGHNRRKAKRTFSLESYKLIDCLPTLNATISANSKINIKKYFLKLLRSLYLVEFYSFFLNIKYPFS